MLGRWARAIGLATEIAEIAASVEQRHFVIDTVSS